MALLKTYHKAVAPKVLPIEVAREFNLSIEDEDYTLKSCIDLINRDSFIIDHKTTKRSTRQDVIDSDLQLSAYSPAYGKLMGRKKRTKV